METINFASLFTSNTFNIYFWNKTIYVLSDIYDGALSIFIFMKLYWTSMMDMFSMKKLHHRCSIGLYIRLWALQGYTLLKKFKYSGIVKPMNLMKERSNEVLKFIE